MAQDRYDYNPSFAAAIVFAALFTVAAGITLFQYFYYRCWFFLFILIGSLMEAVGYIARIYSVKYVYSQGPFVVQFLLVFLAPVLMAASCYMSMARVVLQVTPIEFRNVKSLWVSPRWMTLVFVTCDIVSFLIQVIGGVMTTSSTIKTAEHGYTITKIGLIVQLLAFGFFIVVSFRFHVFSRRFRDQWPDGKWVKFLWAINIASSLIFVRSVYRLIEFAMGANGYFTLHEWNYYVFDAAVIWPVLITFIFLHPAKFLTRLDWKQNKERKAMGDTSAHRLDSADMQMD